MRTEAQKPAETGSLATTYRDRSPAGTRQTKGFHSPMLSGAPDEIVERAGDHVTRSGVDAVNARLHVAGAPAGAVGEQIERFGREVLPALRELVGVGVA